ncbi:MAG: exopolysaccharide Pel transporter PelG [Verrucomicrobiae bacterium]|nr:exopolysaccharide Pel transporter PelG [Verrucomicrobiae bacterium]
MAGIGFRLRRILANPTFGNLVRAYAYAALISSGPLIMSILSLGLLSAVLTVLGHGGQIMVFFAAVTHVYSFTLILTGPSQLVLSRYGADCDFEKRHGKIFSFLLANMALLTPVMAVLGMVFFVGFVPGPLVFRLACVFLGVLVSGIWLLASYLTAMKNYNRVVAAFGIGYGSSFILSWLLVKHFGMAWLMLGFALGHALLFGLLFVAVYLEGGGDELPEKELRRTYWKYRDIALCGLFYNAAIWIDKFLFWWFARDNQHVGGLLYAMPVHDQAVYLGFMSIVPGMAVFLMRLETEFALKYEQFFKQVVEKATLGQLKETKEGMVRALTREAALLVKVQGGISLLLIALADHVMPSLGLGALQTGVFQIIVLGSFLLLLFISFLTVLFYLDKRRDALASCALFLVVNGGVTLFSIWSGEQFYGLGYVVSVAVALVFSAWRAFYHMERLEYDTFTLQPLYG